MNFPLYQKEMKGSWKLLVIFAGILSMYICVIVSMFDPELAQAMAQFEELMPQVMAAVGMTNPGDTLASFLSAYLYGMILLVFPMVYTIIRANGLVARYVEQGSMAQLLSAPVKRQRIVLTQLSSLFTGVVLLVAFCTALEYAAAQLMFPGELALSQLLSLNGGLLALHLFMAGFSFLCSCIFNESKYALGVSAGVLSVSYLLQMLANMGGRLENLKYATFFTLFNPNGLLEGSGSAWGGIGVLLALALLCSSLSILVFCKKDMPV